jgi:hypothetical protein
MEVPPSRKVGVRPKRRRAASPSLDRPTAPHPAPGNDELAVSSATVTAPPGVADSHADGTRFDDLVAYQEELGDDFDALASEHPRGTMLAALAAGIALGFLVGAILSRGEKA